MGKLIDEVGNNYGRLTVIERSGSDRRGTATWLCECSCGNKTVVKGTNLRNVYTRSCGCLRREIMHEIHSLPTGEASFNQLFSHMERHAKRRKHRWGLTKEQVYILTQQPCYYCGMEPKQGTFASKCNGVYLYNGLDRVDNNQDYIIDNVVPCCKSCNRAKDIKTTEQFKIWACALYEHFAK